jgi:hypothetical protein
MSFRKCGIALALALTQLVANGVAAEEPITVSRGGPRELPAQLFTLEPLGDAQLGSLPDQQPIGLGCQQTTAGELRARLARGASAAGADLEARRLQFFAQQQAARDARNAPARAALARLQDRATGGAAAEALDREARELLQRYERASPAERQELDRRADELLWQIQQTAR